VTRTLSARIRSAFADTAALVRFRLMTLRGRGRRNARTGLVVAVLLIVGAALLPAWLPEGDPTRVEVAVLIPSAFLGFMLLTTVAAATSGGGRRLLGREEGVAYPIGPAVDHLGALALAPLNIAWILQAVGLLGIVAYGFGPSWSLVPVQSVTLLGLLAATTTAQVLSWTIEWIRRGPGGRWVIRVGAGACGGVVAWLAWSGRLGGILDRGDLTKWILITQLHAASHAWWGWIGGVTALFALVVGTGLLGAVVAGRVATRLPRDQARLESTHHRPRPAPRSDVIAMLRIDRASVWRSVPLRRGVLTLGALPGGIALAGNMEWPTVALLPGLVCSGTALLFGINIWCLDGRGALWRETLPVEPVEVFGARTIVLMEVLVMALLPTLVLAAFRAGRPTTEQAAAVLCAAGVAILHVVASCVTSSARTPYVADLGDARATPAPPLAMLRHSARLTVGTTTIGLIFNGTAHASASWSLLVALPLILFSCWRIARAASAWDDPVVRSRILTTVAG